MRRHSGQRALYEAISRSQAKSGSSSKPKLKRPGLLERLKPQLEKLRRVTAGKVTSRPQAKEPSVEKPAPTILKPPKPVGHAEPHVTPGPAQTWLKPKAVQFNAGRIEVSLPYQIGIAVGLFVVLMMLAVFRLGQIDQKARYARNDPATRASLETPTAGAPDVKAAPSQPSEPSPAVSEGDNAGAATAPSVPGDNLIVIARAELKKDLEPVQAHFAEHGIQTGFVAFEKLRRHYADLGFDARTLPKGNGYLLVTMQMYDNPDKPGTDGYEAKQKIKEVGALYKGKAPPGAESFAPRYFSDAYGLKVK